MDRRALQARLVKFGVRITQLTDGMKQSISGKIVAAQLAKSGTSPALAYAESENAESSKDFVHKLRVGLKELRESATCLAMIDEAALSEDQLLLTKLKVECNELEAIFVSSINTVIQNQKTPISQQTRKSKQPPRS